MPVSADIYSQIQRPKQVNMLAEMADLANLRGAQQAQELNALKMNALVRAQDRENKLMSLAPQGVNALRSAGFWKEANDIEKGEAEVANKRGQTKKYEADAAKVELETGMKRAGWAAQLLSSATDQASYDKSRAEAVALGLDVSRMPAQFDPAFVQGKLKETLTIGEQLEQEWKRRGYELDTRKVDETARHNRTAEGISAGQLAETRRHNSASEANSRATLEQGKTQILNDPNQGPLLVNRTTGMARPVTDGTGKPIPSDASSKQIAGSRKALAIIDEAEKLIDGATGSFIGAGIDEAARAFGTSPAGADNIAKLKALEGALMMAQPRMEGPQSNLDVALYRQMAARIGDPTVPNDQKKAALTTVRSLHEKYTGGSPTGGASGGWSIQRVN